ncbi:colicin immunity domain-containing protein [Luteimonas sp. RD2P54]|uniref:Colicin immunity domain-containing protein n=1 Tax=Luteimonas endophytica TaxID=3042023 RepID=A0ABT6JDL3_9GAMM|nr:colicin immunity domain-containing protein [Luteimonas endophytica]MDH5824288.1 colicin immunity domain-containing protein [Luteimonas endophytica]
MSRELEEYIDLIDEYLSSSIDSSHFCNRFIAKFKLAAELPEHEFSILDQLFSDADCFTEDQGLIASNPELYINADQLKERAAEALAALVKEAG